MPYIKNRIRDPLYNLIEFRANELENVLWDVIQTREFQRLRRIKQLGFSEFVYPGATHTRFSHCIGTFHIARRLLGIIERESDAFKQIPGQATLAASLLHDLGHGPFSHAFEEVGKRRNIKAIDHEHISNKLIREGAIADTLNKFSRNFSDSVAQVIGDQDDIYSAVVSGGFDADRLDYMQRDRLMTGTYLGTVDLEWLLSNLEVGKVSFALENETPSTRETLVLNHKGIYASEAYIMNLFHMYPSVYFHKTTRCMEKLFTELMLCIMNEIDSGGGRKVNLPAKHCLIRFAKNPDKIENILALDDTIIWGAIDQLKHSENRNISNLSARLANRKIFKCIKKDIKSELLPRVSTPEEKTKLREAFTDLKRQVEAWNLAQRDNCDNLILFDELDRAPYKPALESKKASDRIWLQNNGEMDLLENHSSFLQHVEPFWTARAYVSEADNEAARFFVGILADWHKKLL